MGNFIIRTEDIRPEHILELYVAAPEDQRTVALLKSATPTILEGSRGTGKSFLLRVAEAQLSDSFPADAVLPVYVSFVSSSLLQTKDPNQFLHWMLASLCSRLVRSMYQRGLLIPANQRLSVLTGGTSAPSSAKTPLEAIVDRYERSYRAPGTEVDASVVPTVEEFRDAVEDICRDRDIARIAIFFDEAAHIFRPEQQRQFFTLFRDLRSPFVSCNAAIYPGVTFFGETFQPIHDATIVSLNRDPLDAGYVERMREIVVKQADAQMTADLERNVSSFEALAYAVSGNPRLLLKTVERAQPLNPTEVRRVLREFYRTEIWSEHSSLADKYAGHRAFVDWGRQFVEGAVIPDTIIKNENRALVGRSESTCFFWVHRDAPAAVIEALRLLSYTGIVSRIDGGIVATRGEIGSRFSVNLGCLASRASDPIADLAFVGRNLSVKRFTEYGANYPMFAQLVAAVGQFQEADISSVLQRELAKPIEVLDLTDYQKSGLMRIGMDTVGSALNASESEFQKIMWVGPKRSRRMMNVVVSSVLEYLSG